MIAKIKAQKEQQIIDAEWDEPEEPIIENEKRIPKKPKRKNVLQHEGRVPVTRCFPFFSFIRR